MILRNTFFLLVTALLTMGLAEGDAEENNKAYIAVNDLMRQGVDKSSAMIITDRLRTELFKTDWFKVIERGQMKAILEEQDFQQGECASDACLIEAGQLLGVTHIITGSVGKIGQTFTINLRMIHIQTGEISYTDNTDCMCTIDEVLANSTKNIARKLSNFIQGKPIDEIPLKKAEKKEDKKETGKEDTKGGTSIWKTPWPYVGAGVILVGGGVVTLMLMEPEAEESKSGSITVK
ncbi:MAG: hypothetical protein HQK83_05040 [Fibrobacteria bacterium]|nr:hypothetical protein [Fibrobacteria bacterium]